MSESKGINISDEIAGKSNTFVIENGKVYINGTEVRKVTKIETKIGEKHGFTEVTVSFEVSTYPPSRTNMKLG